VNASPSRDHLALAPGISRQLAQSGSSPQLLQRTFTVLELFTPQRQTWTVTEIGRECNLAVPTVHRILTALHKNGYLVRDEPSKKFRLGPALLRMGRTAGLSVDLRSLALPLLRELSRRTKETALLTVVAEDHRQAVCVERVSSSEPLRLSVEPGRHLPLHAGASQKVLLANVPAPQLEQYVSVPLERLCMSTISDVDVLAQELEDIRRRGWAASYEETNPGVWGLAVGLVDDSGYASAGVGVAGPGACRPRDIKPWLAVLAQTAAQLAEPLGLRPTISPTDVMTGAPRPKSGHQKATSRSSLPLRSLQ
jgi:DNA-binding IclR family transcriptional regulator